MKGCINHKRVWFGLISVGLLLAVSNTGYTQECTDCHGAHGGLFLYQGTDCSACHSAHHHDFSGSFVIPSFHNADGLICNKCHTMHASEDGELPTMPGDAGPMLGPNPHLLYKAEVTDLCLVCHAGELNSTGAPIVLAPDEASMGTTHPLLPGGDFFYTQGAAEKSNGHDPGGTIIGVDNTFTNSPGGTFLSANETCISCHDPHGGSPANDYRLLKLKPGDWTGADLIVVGVEGHPGTDEEGNPPGYGSGFAVWCGACHGDFHNPTTGGSWLKHPTDTALGFGGNITVPANYGATYQWTHPVEWPGGTFDNLTAEVFCLSCHRAHATAYSNSTRWDNTEPSGVDGDGDGAGCNKCHEKG